ncbi:hypothetical protein HKX48_000673 [Thoreauomyces humboldtii]|nr:hypothetical protein HKX48_000673 [Thoreauomyces humboldtii]
MDPQNTYAVMSPWSDPIAQVDITILRRSVQPNSPFVPLLHTEVKKPRVLPFPGTGHLHDRYMQSIALHDQHFQYPWGHVYPIWQIMGSLNRSQLKYGALSTYEYTWFLRREGSVLYISDPIATSDQGPVTCSTMRGYAYILSLALGHDGADGREPSVDSFVPGPMATAAEAGTLPTSDTAATGSNSSGNGNVHSDGNVAVDVVDAAADRIENGAVFLGLAEPSMNRIATCRVARFRPAQGRLVFGDLLGQGLHGTVVNCLWDGEETAYKGVDRKLKAMVTGLINEASIYEKLRSIQGSHVPRIRAEASLDGYQIVGLVMERGRLAQGSTSTQRAPWRCEAPELSRSSLYFMVRNDPKDRLHRLRSVQGRSASARP